VSEVVTYHEKYRPGAIKVARPAVFTAAEVVKMELHGAGRIEVDGKAMEFWDVRVYVRMPPEVAP
jgi:hypothetical protein